MRLHLQPGQRGTKHLLAETVPHICGCYRHDTRVTERFQIVEILVPEHDG